MCTLPLSPLKNVNTSINLFGGGGGGGQMAPVELLLGVWEWFGTKCPCSSTSNRPDGSFGFSPYFRGKNPAV